ncbi:MAG: Ig-like domain-containing protein [Velocimicrobium sp.]
MKKLTRVICVVAFCLVAMMGMSNVSSAATVGDNLTKPENGWQRIDDTNGIIKYIGVFGTGTNPGAYYNSDTATTSNSSRIIIKFYGTKIRIISNPYNNKPKNVSISIDKNNETFSMYTTANPKQTIVYEKTGLELGLHTVIISPPSNMPTTQNILIDAIDIDSLGYFVDPLNLSATSGNSSVILNWEVADGATSYNIKRALTAGGQYEIIGTTSDSTFTDSTVTNNTEYYYVISAVASSSKSTNSNEVTGTPTESSKSNILKVVLEVDEQLQLSVDEDLDENENVTWTSSDATVATVDSNGVVTALKLGNTVVTASSEEESYSESVNILVLEDATDYRLAVDLKVGKKCRLTMDDCQDTTKVTWTVMDSTVATVSSKGKVKAVSEGLTIVTATDANGNEIGQVYVRVRE